MTEERIKEIEQQIETLKEEVERLKAEQLAEERKLSWIKAGTYAKMDVFNGITIYMKVSKIERTPDETIKVYGKRIRIKHMELSTKVSFCNYDEVHIDHYVDISKLSEITEEEWNEIVKKAKEFVENFD